MTFAIVGLFTLAIGIWIVSLKEDAPRLEFEKDSLLPWRPVWQYIPDRSKRIRYPVGKGLYRDSSGNLYLKTKDRRIRNPDHDHSDRPDSMFQSEVSLREKGWTVDLADVLDTASFSRIDDIGVYFADSAYIYVHAIWPYSDQFFALKKAGARFLDREKEYLLVGGKLYSHGKTVEDIDAKQARVVRYKKTNGNGFHEFITDGRVLIHGYYALDEERFSFTENISERDRESIRKRYFKTGSK